MTDLFSAYLCTPPTAITASFLPTTLWHAGAAALSRESANLDPASAATPPPLVASIGTSPAEMPSDAAWALELRLRGFELTGGDGNPHHFRPVIHAAAAPQSVVAPATPDAHGATASAAKDPAQSHQGAVRICDAPYSPLEQKALRLYLGDDKTKHDEFVRQVTATVATQHEQYVDVLRLFCRKFPEALSTAVGGAAAKDISSRRPTASKAPAAASGVAVPGDGARPSGGTAAVQMSYEPGTDSEAGENDQDTLFQSSSSSDDDGLAHRGRGAGKSSTKSRKKAAAASPVRRRGAAAAKTTQPKQKPQGRRAGGGAAKGARGAPVRRRKRDSDDSDDVMTSDSDEDASYPDSDDSSAMTSDSDSDAGSEESESSSKARPAKRTAAGRARPVAKVARGAGRAKAKSQQTPSSPSASDSGGSSDDSASSAGSGGPAAAPQRMTEFEMRRREQMERNRLKLEQIRALKK